MRPLVMLQDPVQDPLGGRPVPLWWLWLLIAASFLGIIVYLVRRIGRAARGRGADGPPATAAGEPGEARRQSGKSTSKHGAPRARGAGMKQAPSSDGGSTRKIRQVPRMDPEIDAVSKSGVVARGRSRRLADFRKTE